MASSWLSNVNSMCTGIQEFLRQQNTSLLKPTKHISLKRTKQVSGRPISLPYLQDRLTSAQKLSRNDDDKEALLWLFSRALFFLLGLVKLVWAAHQGVRKRHQSAWFSSPVFVAVTRMAPASIYTLGPLTPSQSCHCNNRQHTSLSFQKAFWGRKAW